jgi:hypothetical protein
MLLKRPTKKTFINHVSFKGSCPVFNATPDPHKNHQRTHPRSHEEIGEGTPANLIAVKCPWGLGHRYLGKLQACYGSAYTPQATALPPSHWARQQLLWVVTHVKFAIIQN